jgi:hypothetical protein
MLLTLLKTFSCLSSCLSYQETTTGTTHPPPHHCTTTTAIRGTTYTGRRLLGRLQGDLDLLVTATTDTCDIEGIGKTE